MAALEFVELPERVQIPLAAQAEAQGKQKPANCGVFVSAKPGLVLFLFFQFYLEANLFFIPQGL